LVLQLFTIGVNLEMVQKRSWQRFEKKVAKRHRGKYIGGPGKPDYTRGNIHGEVKQRTTPLTKAQVMEECRKGRTEIVCPAGFTEQARLYVKRYRRGKVKLIHGK
jgi:hypothetical protein